VAFWVLLLAGSILSLLQCWCIWAVWKGVLTPRCPEGRHLWVYTEGPPEVYRCGRCGEVEEW
jgi:hypothetical protein